MGNMEAREENGSPILATSWTAPSPPSVSDPTHFTSLGERLLVSVMWDFTRLLLGWESLVHSGSHLFNWVSHSEVVWTPSPSPECAI